MILDLLFPDTCPACRRPIPRSEMGICDRCASLLSPALHSCSRCGGEDGNCFCSDRWFYPLGLSVAWEYTGVARPVLTRIKSGQGRHVIKNLTRRALELWDLPGEFEIVTWIPTGRRSRRERGYDQGKVMAGVVARGLRTYRRKMIETVRGKGHQKGYHLKERYLRAPGSFRVCGDPAGKSVLLVDDVVTTGASLNEGARLLLESGARHVFCLALNRSPIKKLDK